MAILHKISTEFYEEPYDLIALHSSLASFAMAFYLNDYLSMRLERTENDLYLNKNAFSFYEWYDESRDCFYSLYENKTEVEVAEGFSTEDLFNQEAYTTTAYLIEEKKRVDYFLKLEHEETVSAEKLIKRIQNIPKISMAYAIDHQGLKSKDNLISLSDAN